ncbi:hypothetical protein Y032_0223g2685 [Ancylostoma ceylanicum]|uniref:Secreted protein n=1 Tax=Ancylostoma ceylanicum TaxID=53326 RepID=A0A016SIF3_9BILA|nr:hypothetical protein Y032_0223g2685 [Ancylostoma ceylanicum]
MFSSENLSNFTMKLIVLAAVSLAVAFASHHSTDPDKDASHHKEIRWIFTNRLCPESSSDAVGMLRTKLLMDVTYCSTQLDDNVKSLLRS